MGQPQAARVDDAAVMGGYWFAKLVRSVEAGDFILANVARDRLRELGFDVRPARRPRGPGRKAGTAYGTER